MLALVVIESSKTSNHAENNKSCTKRKTLDLFSDFACFTAPVRAGCSARTGEAYDLTANSKGLGMACRCEKNVATKGE